MRYVLGGPLAVPLVDLVGDPSWRPHVSALRIFGQQVLADTPGQFADASQPAGVGPNVYVDLVSSRFFDALQMPFQVEWGAVKDWSPHAVESGAMATTILERMQSAGGYVECLSLDEPWTAARRDCKPVVSPQACLTAVTLYCNVSLARWSDLHFELTEAYPYNRAHDILTWADWMRQFLGEHFTSLCIDCDWRALSWTKSGRDDFAQIGKQCRSWGLNLSLILTPNDPHDAASFVATAKQGAALMLPILQPDELCIESWQPGYPSVVPASDPTSLSALKDWASQGVETPPTA